MIHAATPSQIRGKISDNLVAALRPSTPINGRRATFVFSQSVNNGVTVITPSIRLTGPHRLIAVRFHQSTASQAGSTINLAISQNLLTTDAAFLVDMQVFPWFTQFVSLFPVAVTQRIDVGLDILLNPIVYKVRFSNGSGQAQFYNVTLELQMIGTRN